MRVFALAALAAVSSASLVQVHNAARVPEGWSKVEEKVSRDLMFKNVMIGMKRANVQQVYKVLREVSNPRSNEYLNYPTDAELSNMVRPPAENTQAVKAWLARHGAKIVKETPHGDYLKVEATAAQLENMASGSFQGYKHTSGATVHRITSGVHVPAEVAAAIDTFSGFNGFPLDPVRPVVPEQRKQDQVGACAGCVVTPDFLRKVYNYTTVAASGKLIQAIAQFQGQYVSDSDLGSFCQEYDSSTCKIDKYIGRDNQGNPGVESMLDTEYLVPIGGTTSWVYSYPGRDFCSDLTQFTSDVQGETQRATTISISYGSQKIDFCDTALIQRFSDDVTKLGTEGVSIMISSGDDGSGHQTRQGVNNGKLSPSFPASVPHAVAVGSTYFAHGNSGAEQATTQFGSGGGFSYDFDAPDYQKDVVASYINSVPNRPTLDYAKNGRGSPDVSALGESYTVRSGGQDISVGGTSASSPAFGGFLTKLNEVCMSVSGKTLGFVNPLFYQNPGAFRDVTLGTNAIGRNTQGWAATTGWDASTGLGTPNFKALRAVVEAGCRRAAKRQ